MTRDNWYQAKRLGGLRRFAIAITVLNLLGHTVLGFEQSWAQPLVALAAAYGMEILLEALDARTQSRRPRFVGSPRTVVDFLLSPHISGLAVSMLIYTNERLWPTAFAAAAAIASKHLFRAPAGAGTRHFFNPSNIGITATLLLFPWVGIAPPYHFTENLGVRGDWILPAIIICSGSFVNWRFTERLPLIGAWLGTFAAQALVRHWLLGSSLTAALLPMTGVAFILYTFYMVTDPATTPSAPRAQAAFGAAVAAVYGLLMTVHIVLGLFFALSIVCAARGLGLYALAWRKRAAAVPAPVEIAVAKHE
jgi:Na+-translocating ferredoxin:NAD+ oxidoreductase RnfD subunit